MKNKWLGLFFILVLIKSLVWLVLVPIFQVPDEPSHFSIVEFIAEKRHRPHPRREVVTPLEIIEAAQIVNFDWQINHPVWRGYQADWLDKLGQINPDKRRKTVDNPGQTSLKRPPLYYYSALPFYFLGRDSFLSRFFLVRGLNVLVHLLTVWLAFLIGKKVFGSFWLGVATAALVAFQPMLSFFSASVHYDPLAIFLATWFIYLLLNLRRGLSLAVSLLGVLVKPDLIILPFFWLWRFLNKKRWLFWLMFFGVVFSLTFLADAIDRAIPVTAKYDRLLYLTNLNEYAAAAKQIIGQVFSGEIFAQFSRYLQLAGPTHLAQIFPWYWGTFGWLEVPLPAVVFTLLKALIIISIVGWIRFIHRQGFPRRLMFFLGFALIQAGVVVINDFLFFADRGEVYGIQGRYFFPAVVAHMILLIFGLRQWFGEKILAKSLIGLSLFLNAIGLITVYQYFGWVWGN